MSPGGKIFLTLAAAGGVLGVLAIAGSKTAHAATTTPKPQKPTSNQPPDFVVPETPIVPGATAQVPSPPAPAAQAPAPQATTPQAPAAQPLPAGAVSLPNPLGGPPLGVWDPATGNVFGPLGLIIGKFDPKTGIFTTPGGTPIQVPGFGQAPAPAAAPAATPGPVPAPVAPPAAIPTPSAAQASVPAPAATPGPVPAPAVTPTPIVLPVPASLPLPLPVPATVPVSTVSSDTAQMVAALLDAESRPGWNRVDPSVTAWQKARPPMKADGMFGPNTALLVAREFGTIPLIRFWPKGSQKAAALNAFQAALIDLANRTTDQIRAKQLRLSAQREQALAFSNVGPLPALSANSLISLARVA